MNTLSSEFANEVGSQAAAPDDATKALINQMDAEKQLAEINNYKQNTDERKKYAERIFQFTCFWCMFVGVILLGYGIGKFHFSDLILTTLLGTMTVNVFAFFMMVTKYLFNESKST